MAQVHDVTASFRIASQLREQLEMVAKRRSMSFGEYMRSVARRELEEAAQ